MVLKGSIDDRGRIVIPYCFIQGLGLELGDMLYCKKITNNKKNYLEFNHYEKEEYSFEIKDKGRVNINSIIRKMKVNVSSLDWEILARKSKVYLRAELKSD